MKADQLARRYAKQTAKLVALDTEVLQKQPTRRNKCLDKNRRRYGGEK